MDIRLKHRLVGAAVLVSIGVIFIPMLLDGSPPVPAPVALEPLPPTPGAGFVPKRIDLVLPAAPSPPPATTVEPSVPAPEVIQPLAEGSAWVIQVGSFGNEANARALRDKLRGMGYAAFDETVKGPDGKPSTRVRIGPDLERARLAKIQARLSKELSLDGIVMPHR